MNDKNEKIVTLLPLLPKSGILQLFTNWTKTLPLYIVFSLLCAVQ